VKDVADARIWRLFRRIVAAGREMGEAPAPEQLHELRKDCKKLRYLMEFFASLYAPEVLDPLIAPLGLTDTEIDDLVSFLESLTGDNVNVLVSDAFAAPVGDPSDGTASSGSAR
jgi:CHAD domain-containing protein